MPTTKLPIATAAQLQQIKLHAVNDTTREVAAGGIYLTHEQADELGAEMLDWMHDRLGLRQDEEFGGVRCTPRPRTVS